MQIEKLGCLLTLLKDYFPYKIFHHKIVSNGQLQWNIRNNTQIWLICNSLEYIQNLNNPVIMFYHLCSIQLKYVLYYKSSLASRLVPILNIYRKEDNLWLYFTKAEMVESFS